MLDKLRKDRIKTPEETPIEVAISILNKRIETLQLALDAAQRKDAVASWHIDTGVPMKESEGKDVEDLAQEESFLRSMMQGEMVREHLPKLATKYADVASHLFSILMMEITRSGGTVSYDELKNVIWDLEKMKDYMVDQKSVADPRLN